MAQLHVCCRIKQTRTVCPARSLASPMAAQRPPRRPAASEDTGLPLKGKQPLRSGPSKARQALQSGFQFRLFPQARWANRWIFTNSIAFAFFSPPKKKKKEKELIILGEELESIIPSYAFIDLVYDSYAEAPVWSPTISNPLLGDGQVTREAPSSIAPQGTTPKMPAGGHRRPRPEGNVETQTRLKAQPCDSAPQNGLAHLPRPAPTAARPPPSPWATSPSEPRSGTVLVDAQTRGTSGPRGSPGLQLQGGARGRGRDPTRTRVDLGLPLPRRRSA